MKTLLILLFFCFSAYPCEDLFSKKMDVADLIHSYPPPSYMVPVILVHDEVLTARFRRMIREDNLTGEEVDMATWFLDVSRRMKEELVKERRR